MMDLRHALHVTGAAVIEKVVRPGTTVPQTPPTIVRKVADASRHGHQAPGLRAAGRVGGDGEAQRLGQTSGASFQRSMPSLSFSL